MRWTQELLQAEQMRLEQASFDGGVERYKRAQQRAIESGEASATNSSRRLTKEFIEPMSEGIEAYIAHVRAKGGRPAKAVPYLECVPPLTLAYLTVKTVLDMLPMDGSLQHVAIKIGGRIEDQARFTKIEDVAPGYVKKVKETLKRVRSKSYRHQREVMAAAERKLTDQKTGPYAIDIDRWAEWPKADLLHVGLTMIEVMTQTLTFQGESVFRVSRHSRRDPYHIEISGKVSDWCSEFDEFIGQMSPDYSPCVVPPRAWKGPKNGGYYMPEVARTLPLVKVYNRKHLKRLTYDQMPEVYDALNALQEVPWEINTSVLDTAQEVNKLDLAIGMPQAEPFRPPEAPVRPELEGLRGEDLKNAMTADEFQEFKEWKGEARKVYEAENTRASKYMDASRALQAARTFSRYPALYFVYTLDSRSRVYCRSSQFGPQGGDLQKALVRFHNAEPLGEHGRYWLAIQGANVWGEDKVSFDEREAFIAGMEEQIRDIAADPLTFREWANADKPWQFLAWALEWNELLEWEDEGRDAADFLSRTPVAQDGSCSGIQHYSAMLRDGRGGAAVNLTPSDKPQDIYGAVAEVVTRKMQGITSGDLKVEVNSAGKELDEQTIAKLCKAWLSTGVDRKLCKKSVMTLAYGSTMLTCRASISDRLDELDSEEQARAKAAGRSPNPVHPFGDNASELPAQDGVAVCTRLLWDSIGEVVVAARHGMAFIQKVAGQVAKANMPLEWTTPTGFIVEQATYQRKRKIVYTQLLGKAEFSVLEDTDDIDVNKMKSSAAPNYVHSMDASHLIRSVNAFKRAGLGSVAVIHDSFGTHAGKTEALRGCLKAEFVELYMEDWLTSFKDEVEELIKEEIDEEVPMIGTLDLLDIFSAEYAFA